MCAKEEPATSAVNDVWGDDSDGEGANAESSQLEREWEARRQQFYNTGYRDGLDEGKELTLQLGFNAGFSEGAESGFRFGVIKGALQILAAMYTGQQETLDKVKQLLQQVNALPNRTIMRDSCLAMLQQPPAGAAGQDLQQALQQLQLDDGVQSPDAAAAAASITDPVDVGTAGDISSSVGSATSSEQQQGLSLPQQLVEYVRVELLKLGFDVGLGYAAGTSSSGTEDAVGAMASQAAAAGATSAPIERISG